MDVPQLHHLWTKTRHVKPVYFLTAAAVSGTVCVLTLRHNYLEMSRLRNDVYTADKNDTNVQQALQKLQVYVSAHMNTDLSTPNGPYPPVQLEYTYDRAVQAAGNAATAANASVYTDAQHYCESAIPNGFSGSYRIQCVQTYIDGHGATLPTIPDGLYKFDFLSPSWSPDVAGWTLFITVVFLVCGIGSWLINRRLRRLTK